MVINAYLNKQKFQIITSHLKDLKFQITTLHLQDKNQSYEKIGNYEIIRNKTDLKKHETKSRFFKSIKLTNFWLD